MNGVPIPAPFGNGADLGAPDIAVLAVALALTAATAAGLTISGGRRALRRRRTYRDEETTP